jgi:hypothetical protein
MPVRKSNVAHASSVPRRHSCRRSPGARRKGKSTPMSMHRTSHKRLPASACAVCAIGIQVNPSRIRQAILVTVLMNPFRDSYLTKDVFADQVLSLIVTAFEVSAMPTQMLVVIYVLLMSALVLIVRRAYNRYREEWSGPTSQDLERGITAPYSPPPERQSRSFDARWRHT